MPRVHKVKARADIYAEGKRTKADNKQGYSIDRSKPAGKTDIIIVKKGQEYYHWSFRYGGKRISLTPPKPRQLTQSEFLITLYDIEEQYSAAVAAAKSAEDLQAARDEAKEALETLRDEQEEKKNNMPESLQESATGELLQERYDNVDNIVNELDNIDLDADEDDEDNTDWLDEKRSECEGIDFMA